MSEQQRIARRGVSVVRRPTGSWCVYLDGQFISDHATHQAARRTAQQVARIEADSFDPYSDGNDE